MDNLPGYNEHWKPERQTDRGLPGKNRLVILFFIGMCTAALLLGVIKQVSANGDSHGGNQAIQAGSPAQTERVSLANLYIEPGEVQGDRQIRDTTQPEILYGLAASLSGALVMGMSFLVLQRQRAQ